MLNSKVAKNILSKFSFFGFWALWLLHGIFLSILSINYFSKSISKNKLNNVLPCEIYTNQVTNILEADYQITRKSISFFPEIKNINCLNKISNIEVLNDFVLLEAVTSFRFVSYIQSLTILLLFLFIYSSKDRLSKKIIYLSIFSILLIQELFFSFTIFNFQFIFVFFIKYLLVLGILKSFLNYKIYDFEIFFYIFIVTFCFINIEFLINKDELFYFGNALLGNNDMSSHSTTSHALAFNLVIGYLFPLLNIGSKFLIDIFLSLWFSFLCLKFGKLFELKNIYLLVYPVLLLDYQAGIGGDSIFGAVVPKSFSYLLIFTGLYFLLQRKYIIFTITYGLSFYFHYASSIILSPVIGYLAFKKLQKKDFFKSVIAGVIVVLPITYNILVGEFGVSSNEIKNQMFKLITVRLPHHFYPFIFEDGKFLKINPYWNNSLRLLLILLTFVFILNYLMKKKSSILNTLVFTNFIILSYLGIIYLFPFSSFVVTHPWRIISLFMVLLVTYLVKQFNKTNLFIPKVFFLSIFLYFNFFNIEQAASNFYHPENKAETSDKIINKLNELQPELLIIPAYKQEHMQSPFLDIELKTSIPTYATYKFTPVKISSYNVWEERIQKISNFYEGNCNEFDQSLNAFFLDLNETNPCGTVVFKDRKVYLYKLSKNE